MVRVMASGVFDIIHTGHLSYLEQARAMGDELIVVVACDETVRRSKHEPVTPEDMRVRLVNALKPVDKAVLGKSGGDIYSILKEIEPDVIVLGYDQTFDEKALERKLADKGYDIRVCRADRCADDLTATRRIIQKILETGGGL
ncbi:MAG: FAD synthase [Thermoplasmatales archaeon]|jgi:FAD synthetase|nr:FAD synthase [Thermoplasmatales archaeon]